MPKSQTSPVCGQILNVCFSPSVMTEKIKVSSQILSSLWYLWPQSQWPLEKWCTLAISSSWIIKTRILGQHSKPFQLTGDLKKNPSCRVDHKFKTCRFDKVVLVLAQHNEDKVSHATRKNAWFLHVKSHSDFSRFLVDRTEELCDWIGTTGKVRTCGNTTMQQNDRFCDRLYRKPKKLHATPLKAGWSSGDFEALAIL